MAVKFIDTKALTRFWTDVKAYLVTNYAPIGAGGGMKCTGAEINTGTDDTKFATPKAVKDSNLVFSTDDTVQNVIALTKAAYDALETKDTKTMYVTTDETEAAIDTTANATAGDTDDSKGYFHIGDFCVQWGRVAITPSGAGTPTSKSVTFPVAFNAIPFVVVGLNSTVPGSTVTGWSCTTPSTTAVTIYVTRGNTTATALYWIAIGYKA